MRPRIALMLELEPTVNQRARFYFGIPSRKRVNLVVAMDSLS